MVNKNTSRLTLWYYITASASLHSCVSTHIEGGVAVLAKPT